LLDLREKASAVAETIRAKAPRRFAQPTTRRTTMKTVRAFDATDELYDEDDLDEEPEDEEEDDFDPNDEGEEESEEEELAVA
jgi:hypothetical protein